MDKTINGRLVLHKKPDQKISLNFNMHWWNRLQIPDDPVTIINDEHDQEGFNALEDEAVRVIGYFEPGSVGKHTPISPVLLGNELLRSMSVL